MTIWEHLGELRKRLIRAALDARRRGRRLLDVSREDARLDHDALRERVARA